MKDTSAPKLSVVIPTRKGSRRLGDLLVSILRQQTPPPFEVLVVANSPKTAVERLMTGLDPRFRCFSAGQPGVNHARSLGLREAKGEIVLFLDEDCFLEEPFILRRHFDLHKRHPDAIGVGGRYALKRRSTTVEQAYHWIGDHWLSASKTDRERTMNLIGGNASFKADPLRASYRFNDSIAFDETEADLNMRLFLSGRELILSERLGVEHRLDMSAFSLLKKGFLQGRSLEKRERDGLVPPWRFQGARQTLEGNMAERGLAPGRAMKFFFNLYDLAFRAGRAHAKRSPDAPVTIPRIVLGLAREWVDRVRKLPRSPFFREMDHALRFSAARPHALAMNDGGRESHQRSSRAKSEFTPSPPGAPSAPRLLRE